jgi:hypothetical protein
MTLGSKPKTLFRKAFYNTGTGSGSFPLQRSENRGKVNTLTQWDANVDELEKEL